MSGRTFLCQGGLFVALALLLLSVPSSAQPQKCTAIATTRNPSRSAFRPPFATTDASGQLVYNNPSYVFELARGEHTNVCNLVSVNGYYSLAFLPVGYLTNPGVDIPGFNFNAVVSSVGCLVTRSIRGEIIEGMCFETDMSGYSAPKDGCSGVSIQVGRNIRDTGESGVILSISRPGEATATWIQGLLLGGDTFSSFFIDIQGRMSYVADSNSGADSSGLALRNIYKDISLRGCFFPQQTQIVSSMPLTFASERRCDSNCTKSPAFSTNNPTPQVCTLTYQFDTSTSTTRTYTKYIEKNWEITSSVSSTFTKTVTVNALIFSSVNRFSYTATVSSTNSHTQARSNTDTTTTSTSSSYTPQFTIPANSAATLYQTLCRQTCTTWNTSPVIATLVDFATGLKASFVTRAYLMDTTTYDVQGFSLGVEPATAL